LDEESLNLFIMNEIEKIFSPAPAAKSSRRTALRFLPSSFRREKTGKEEKCFFSGIFFGPGGRFYLVIGLRTGKPSGMNTAVSGIDFPP
jgi:hypothetical protein